MVSFIFFEYFRCINIYSYYKMIGKFIRKEWGLNMENELKGKIFTMLMKLTDIDYHLSIIRSIGKDHVKLIEKGIKPPEIEYEVMKSHSEKCIELFQDVDIIINENYDKMDKNIKDLLDEYRVSFKNTYDALNAFIKSIYMSITFLE